MTRLHRRISLVLIAAALIVGCGEAPRVTPKLEAVPQALTWPAPPEVARYAYAGTLLGEQDFIVRTKGDDFKDWARGVGEFVTGMMFGPKRYQELHRPVAGMVDQRGRILVTDASEPRVFVFDMRGQKVESWRAAAPGQGFVSPVGIADDGAGGYLVADAELKYVSRLNASGQPQGKIGEGVLERPTGVARDPVSGNIFVADTTAHDIAVFSRDGKLLKRLGGRGGGPGQFNYPSHLALHDKALYVSDTLNFRVQKLSLDGTPLQTIGTVGPYVGNMTRPKGVAVGGDGRLYVVESYYDRLLVFDDKGTFLLPLGGTGAQDGLFYLPAGVWTDDDGRVYVADMFNGRISVFKELTRGRDL